MVLQASLEHHPDLFKYKIENDRLKTDIARIAGEHSVNSINSQKAEELLDVFNKMRALVDAGEGPALAQYSVHTHVYIVCKCSCGQCCWSNVSSVRTLLIRRRKVLLVKCQQCQSSSYKEEEGGNVSGLEGGTTNC